MKQVLQHLKTRDGRRQDLQRQQQKQQKHGTIDEEEMQLAHEKYEESSELAQASVANFLETEADQIQILKQLVEIQLQFHGQSAEIFKTLDERLQSHKKEVIERPKKVHRPKRIFDEKTDCGDSSFPTTVNDEPNDEDEEITRLKGEFSAGPAFVDVPLGEDEDDRNPGSASVGGGGFCVALYDYSGGSEADLRFSAGDNIEVVQRVDENWLRGRLVAEGENAKQGIFPEAYVKMF